jgi:hypothetical protein
LLQCPPVAENEQAEAAWVELLKEQIAVSSQVSAKKWSEVLVRSCCELLSTALLQAENCHECQKPFTVMRRRVRDSHERWFT